VGSLSGRVALVTGASRGIGAAIAQRFAAEGAAVAATARSLAPHPKLPGTLRETVEAIEGAGGRALALVGDAQSPEDRARVVEQARTALGPIDLLVNNAAAAFYMPFEKVSEKRFHLAFEINVRAPWDFAQRVLSDMRARGGGAIVNVSSATADLPVGPPWNPFHAGAGDTLYGATKAALERISAGLATELWPDGIVVNAVAPVAAVMTPGVEALGVVPEHFRESAEPVEDVVEAVLALAEEREPPITGRVLRSRPFLEEIGRTVRSLDGKNVLREPDR